MKQNRFDGVTKLDADESSFFLRQLDYIKQKVYEIKYVELLARKLFPVNFEGGSGIDTVVYFMLDHVGLAKIIANYSVDLPRVDVIGKETRIPVKELGASYGYSIKEIRRAMYANVPLRQRKADAAKKAILVAEEKIAFNGDSSNGLYGILSHPNTNTLTIPQNAGHTSTLWKNKTADEILADLNYAANTAAELTNGIEISDTLLLPIAQYNLIANTRMTTLAQFSILKYFLENSPYIKEVIPVPQLKGAGALGGDVLVAYKKDPEKLELCIPSDFEQFPEQMEGLEYVIPCMESIAGINMYYPMSMSIGEGI